MIHKTARLAMALLAASSAAWALPAVGGERSAPVTLAAGQGLRVIVANVRLLTASASPDACPMLVRFFGTDGAPLGTEQDASLPPGVSISITAIPYTGLARAIVSVNNST